ncbi:MAG: hypothetical protein L6277_11720 [Desulfobacterales bacterium]|nr:hypothetical protein [Pseudomonadota bacterium]MBU4355225.1 hypothetical protein [Pseudomonadota bacterium]MCG2772739.1 hypothetical protein [Desulfobacterales bacterium]
MQIPCSRIQAIFAFQGVRLDRRTPASMVWDEHGGTFVLRVDELAATEVAAGEPETGIILEIPLSLPEGLIRSLEEFAAQQQLPLSPPSGPELLEDVVLAACHLPVQNLFVFAEEPRLEVKRRGEAVELTLTGAFKARRLPCQETDLVIHLTRAAMTRLVALVLSLARGGL